MRSRLQLLVLVALCAGATAARAEPPIATAAPGGPPAPQSAPALIADQESADAIGAWARDVIAGRPSAETAQAAQAAKAQACPPADGKPHGEVWAGVGTGGYREVGGVVTQPVGDCGQITIGVSKTQGDYRRRWR